MPTANTAAAPKQPSKRVRNGTKLMRDRAWTVLISGFLLLFWALACGRGGSDPVDFEPEIHQAQASIGEEGGTIRLLSRNSEDQGEEDLQDEVVLIVPMGAIDRDDGSMVSLSISRLDGVAPDDYQLSSPVYLFEPQGLEFASPLEVHVRFQGEATLRSLFWSTPDGSGFDPMASYLEGQMAIGRTFHFSQAFVGHQEDVTCQGVVCDPTIPDPICDPNNLQMVIEYGSPICRGRRCVYPERRRSCDSQIRQGEGICLEGRCVILHCNVGYADCNGLWEDGCEASLIRSPSHCGACHNRCRYPNASGVCRDGQCRLGDCEFDYGNCDGSEVTGCETYLLGNHDHCGRCNAACRRGQVCVDGSCTTPACTPPNPCGGCETLEGTPGDDCGDCGTLVCHGMEVLACLNPDPNPCGGCNFLDDVPGAACGQCGVVACDGPDRVRCSDPGPNGCGGCSTLEGLPGRSCGEGMVWECVGQHHVVCVEGEGDDTGLPEMVLILDDPQTQDPFIVVEVDVDVIRFRILSPEHQGAAQYRWILNGLELTDQGEATLVVPREVLGVGLHRVTVLVIDQDGWIHSGTVVFSLVSA